MPDAPDLKSDSDIAQANMPQDGQAATTGRQSIRAQLMQLVLLVDP